MLSGLRETVEKYGLMAKKSLGQNFLLDMNITDKIVRESLEKQKKSDFSDCNAVEIGPGPGGLTRAVLQHFPKSLTVIEADERCIEIMRELKAEYSFSFEIIHGDAMEQNVAKIVPAPRCIISNLPYNISVPLLTGWLQNAKEYQSLTLMFQKEVAQRIMAETGSKEYGRLSVLAQLTTQVIKLFDINPNCFVPAPKIWSTVLLFLPKEEQPSPEELSKVENITKLAFGQRRKMIRQSLKSIPNITGILEKLKISPELRAEDVSPQQYLQLANNI